MELNVIANRINRGLKFKYGSLLKDALPQAADQIEEYLLPWRLKYLCGTERNQTE